MATYFDYLLMRNNYDYKKAYNEFTGIGNTTSVPKGKKQHTHYIHLSENVAVNKNLIEKYSIETYLAKGKTIGTYEHTPTMGVIADRDGNRIIFTRYKCEFRSGFSLYKHEVKEYLDEGRLKVSISSLPYLIDLGILKN